jgi:carbon-monoxide dehydrogenase medium subunit
MKPPRFAYHDPQTQSEALALLEQYGDEAKLLAGGQSLVPLLNMRLTQPEHLVDINHIAGLAYIREEQGGLSIGALTRHRDVERSELVRRYCPLLAEAMPYIGHAPIRSRGTMGGSLAHADPAAEIPAVLVALGGRVQAESSAGSREMAAEAFFVSQLQTLLQSNELLTAVWFPAAPAHTGVAFVEISRRFGDFALVGVAAQLTLAEDHAIIAAHLALMGVGETPLRASQAELFLLGKQAGEDVFRAAAELASNGLAPDSDLHATGEYRRDVARVLVERALSKAAERAQQGGKA